jgi:hypothetical protein
VVTPALLMLAIALPTAVGYGVAAVWRGLLRWWDSRHTPATDTSLDKLRADLRRLHDQLDAIEVADVPGKYLRCQAVRGAYLDALVTACLRVGVTPPVASASGRVRQAEIYRVEADLRGHGVDVRDARTVR